MKSANRFSLLISVVALLLSGTSLANEDNADSVVDELKRCAVIGEKDTRFDCYDALGKSLLGSQITETSIPQEISQANDGPSEKKGDLPESLGGGIYAEKAGVKAETHRGKIKSCKKAADRKWFYIFENGQVWKQVDRRKRRHKECDFWVTIVKDSFGYKMIIDGQDSKIRINRHR